MFSKRSRYYKLEESAFPDRKDIKRQCKAVRRLSPIGGQFLHTLEASDRLDHLAYKYYRQSLHWWRICDANLEFTTPLALLDKTPSSTIQLELSTSDSPPPLAELYRTLQGLTGIEAINKGNDNGLPVMEIGDSAPMFTVPDTLQVELDGAVLAQQMSVALDTALQAAGLTLTGELRFTKPNDTLWQVVINNGLTIYRFHHSVETSLISATEGLITHRLSFFITYNRNSIEQQQITGQISALGFDIDELIKQTRVGQTIVIPPRYTGKG